MPYHLYTKKPITIKAAQYDGTESKADALIGWAKSEGVKIERIDVGPGDHEFEVWLHVHTLEGVMTCRPGDWIIQGVEGEFYPCAPSIFDKTYDRAGIGV